MRDNEPPAGHGRGVGWRLAVVMVDMRDAAVDAGELLVVAPALVGIALRTAIGMPPIRSITPPGGILAAGATAG